MARVLVIDADEAVAESYREALCDEHHVYTAFDARTGLFLLTAEPWDVMVLDPNLARCAQGSLVQYAQELSERPELIVSVHPGEMDRAIAEVRVGVFQFLTKPLELDVLRKSVANAAQLRSLRLEKRQIDQRNREQRAELQALVQERTEQMEQIFANAPGMLYRVVVHPEQGRIFSFVSASCQDLLGLPHDSLTEDPDRFDALVHPEDRSRFQQCRDLAERNQTHFRFEGRFILPTGRLRWLQCVAKPSQLLGSCLAYDGILMDITERMELQSQLLLSDRLASVGTMAASVAHEVNNPLFYVSANLEALGEQLENTPELNGLVREALDGVARIETAMRDLRTFVRSPEEVSRPVSVTKVLDASVRLASNEIRHRARLVRDYQGDVSVIADESSLGQLFLNLLVASAQSMPEGNAKEHELRVTVTPGTGEVEVCISDTSEGRLAEELERAFDVFADVSERMRSGMGLYVCQRIVSTLGGRIRASSERGRGNTFSVRLPTANYSWAESMRPRLRLVRANVLRVLVVDDEELVLRALSRTLEGHTVVCARSGREAIRLLEQEPAFDLVLCDVMMPDMTGEDVYEAAGRVQAGLKERIVFVTGGAFTQNANSFLSRVPNRRIEKPFSKASIRELLADLYP